MIFFDFHHHDFYRNFGIYNLKYGDEIQTGSFSAGIHPNEISEDIEDYFFWLKEISLEKNCVAIGECGLDGLVKVDEKLQEDIFAKQIDYANQIRKPIIIHCVRRFSRLNHFKKRAKVPMIIHGFNKRKTIGDDLLKNDFSLSFGQSILYDVNLQNFFKKFPLHKIFLESDSADFNLDELYEKAAFLKNMKLNDFVSIINENIHNLKIPTENAEKLA